MKTPKSIQPKRPFITALLLLLLTCTWPAVATAATLSWGIAVSPSGSGDITWVISNPTSNGTISTGKLLKPEKWATVDLTFKAKPGFKLVSVLKNGVEVITWLDSNGHYQFGPITSPHGFVAKFELLNPTGTFSGNYVEGAGLTAMADVTGNYNGTTTVNGTARDYNADLAMDESGKITALGTATGIANKAGSPTISGSVGSIKTVADKPTAALKGTFAGSVDGDLTTASGSASGDCVLKTVVADKKLEGVAGGSAVRASQKYTAKSEPRSIVVPPEDVAKLKKDWGLTLTFKEVTPAKGKKYVEVDAKLHLTSGEYSDYPAKKATYSAKNGYSISFTNGLKLNRSEQQIYVKNPKTGLDKLDRKGNKIPVYDKKSTVKITKMLLDQSGSAWTPASGTIQYKFLGQSGKGDLKTFLE